MAFLTLELVLSAHRGVEEVLGVLHPLLEEEEEEKLVEVAHNFALLLLLLLLLPVIYYPHGSVGQEGKPMLENGNFKVVVLFMKCLLTRTIG